MEQTVEPRTAAEHTRPKLHAIAECLAAGPQHRATGEIGLRITASGFATTAGPDLELDGLGLVNSQGKRIDAVGTFGEVGAVGVIFGPPDVGYTDGSVSQPLDPILLDHHEVCVLEELFVRSDGAVRIPDPTQTPMVWPEHFDVAILQDGHSMGALFGDEAHPRLYGYLDAHHNDGSNDCNVAFGALRDATDLTTAADLLAFWREGLARIAAHGARARA
jgi:hypothetical protein